MMTWWTWALIALFLWHEADEVAVFPSYVRKYAEQLRGRIPRRMFAALGISRTAFALIAAEQLAIIALILWLSGGEWAWALAVVYTAHMLAHIAQFGALKHWGVPIPPLLSPLWQLPLLLVIAILYVPWLPASTLVMQVVAVGVIAVGNLGLMHMLAMALEGRGPR